MNKITALSVGLAFFASNASALDFGVAAKVGINGVGVDLSVGLTDNINLRLTTASIDVDDDDETVTVGDDGNKGDIEADLDFDYGANAVLLDWHAFKNSFRFTVGLLKNNGSADIDGVLKNDIVVDGNALATDDLVNSAIGGDLDLGDSYQPYIGIGWGRGAGGDGGFSLSVDLGVAMFDPDVDFDATVNPGGTNGYTQAQLNLILKELEDDAEDDADDYDVWPVFAIGVNYAF